MWKSPSCLCGRGPVRRSCGVAESGSHFCQREEEHFHAGKVVVAVGLEERAARVVEDLGRAGERQPQQAVGAGPEQRAQANADLAAERVGAVAQEQGVPGMTPVQIEEVRVPGAHGGGEAVLAPAAERLAGEAHHARHRGAGGVVEVPRELAENGQAVPEVIEEACAFLEVAGGAVGDVGHLGVEVVVVIALPRRERAGVGGPDTLQGHRRRTAARGGAVEIPHQAVLLKDVWLGDNETRTLPEAGPPGRVRGGQLIIVLLQRGLDSGARDGDWTFALRGGGDGHGDEGRIPETFPAGADGVGEAIGAGLVEPAQVAGLAGIGRRVKQFLDRVRWTQPQVPHGWTGDAHDGDWVTDLGGVDEGADLAAIAKAGDGFRGGEVQLEPFERLGRVQRNLQPACRELGGRAIIIVI